MYTHHSKFTHKQTVYLVTDTEQLARIITDLEFNAGRNVVYVCALGTESSKHYEFELSDVKNESLRLGLDKMKDDKR